MMRQQDIITFVYSFLWFKKLTLIKTNFRSTKVPTMSITFVSFYCCKLFQIQIIKFSKTLKFFLKKEKRKSFIKRQQNINLKVCNLRRVSKPKQQEFAFSRKLTNSLTSRTHKRDKRSLIFRQTLQDQKQKF